MSTMQTARMRLRGEPIQQVKAAPEPDSNEMVVDLG